MSLSEIMIYRQLPIINGYVQILPNLPADRTRFTTDEVLSLIDGSNVATLGCGCNKQDVFLLPPAAADNWYAEEEPDPPIVPPPVIIPRIKPEGDPYPSDPVIVWGP